MVSAYLLQIYSRKIMILLKLHNHKFRNLCISQNTFTTVESKGIRRSENVESGRHVISVYKISVRKLEVKNNLEELDIFIHA
jgi:hypothetical protein